ncbi:hypothetical protein CsSME_00005591 [Camellia sinensis var. sinensis]
MYIEVSHGYERFVCVFFSESFEESSSYDERKELQSDYEISEDDKNWEFEEESFSTEDVWDAKELKVVDAFCQELISNDLLPARHNDYHLMLR